MTVEEIYEEMEKDNVDNKYIKNKRGMVKSNGSIWYLYSRFNRWNCRTV